MAKKHDATRLPSGWGFGPTPSGSAPAPVEKAERAAPIAYVDEGWIKSVRERFVAFVCVAAPHDEGFTASLSDWMISWLGEYSERGIRLYQLLDLARRAAGEMPISGTHRYAFIGIVAAAATEIEPKREREEKRTPPFLIEAATELVRVNLFGENDIQADGETLDSAIAAARERLHVLLPPKMVPRPKTMRGWFGEAGAPKPRQGRPRKK